MILQNDDTPKEKMNSVEAASLLISDGATKDPRLAAHIQDGGNPFNMDALQRAHLRRMMGCDFEIGINELESTFTVWTKEGPYVELSSKYSGVIDERAIDILVETCLMVKQLWERDNDTTNR